ncbi:MAG: o-succinylbenzoate--CoA ligase [Actinomycetes bacterium]
MTGNRPLIALTWPAGDAGATDGSTEAAVTTVELIERVDDALRGGPALALIPGGPAVRHRSLLDALGPQHPLESPDIAFVVPTSGTSGAPNGVLLTAAAVTHSARATHEALGGPGHWLLALPPTHVAGLLVLARAALAGMDPVIMDPDAGFGADGFAAAAAGLASAARRYTALVPTQLDRLLAGETGRAALSRFDAILLGGAPAPARLLSGAAELGVRVVGTYGMTETAGGCVYDGRPLPGVRVEVDRGQQIRISGPNLASGYRLRPDLTAQRFRDGWFRTADYGVFTPDGRLEVLGRTDDAVITGGVKVSAARVAALLVEHPRIASAAVFGVPDPEWGERLVATVVPRDPAYPPGLDEVRRWVRDRAEAAMAPKELVVAVALPTLESGKVDIRAVRTAYQAPARAAEQRGES